MDVLLKKLEICGGLGEIYNAIDTNDTAIISKTAMSALIKAKHLPHDCSDAKSPETSEIYRNTGNEHYKSGRNRLALLYYNKASAYAPRNSKEMMLAYSNKSVVLFNIRYFTSSQTNAKKALAMGCPKNLANKLQKRINETTKYVCEQMYFDIYTSNLFILSYFHNFKFDSIRNAEVDCVISDVAFVNEKGAKRAVAGKDIKTGTVVAIERAFASCVTVENQYLTCHHCHFMDPSLTPCDGCSHAFFCENECRDQCITDYHRIECQIMGQLINIYEKPLNALVTKTAIKLSLKLGWEALITASKDIGASRMRTATIRQTYNSEEPLSILSYDDDKVILEGRIFNGSIVCASVLHCLDKVPDYFPKESQRREAAMDALSRIMLHMYVTFTNNIPILCSAYDFNSKKYKCGVQTNYGWFSMSSKLKHSCEPNLMVVGLNDSVALVALRMIKKNEELTISYIEHFYDFKILHRSAENAYRRARRIFQQIRHICDCRVCVQEWDTDSNKPVAMTNRQKVLFEKFRLHQDHFDHESYNITCKVLDAFPVNSTQHKKAYEDLRGVINIIQCKETSNTCFISID